MFTLSKILVTNFYLFESYQKYLHWDKGNRPFYRYGGHIELIRFKEYYGMPGGGGRGDQHDPKKIVMGKKDRCAVFGCNKERLFPEKYTVKFSFCPKRTRKY